MTARGITVKQSEIPLNATITGGHIMEQIIVQLYFIIGLQILTLVLKLKRKGE
jgi:hypothetical protein